MNPFLHDPVAAPLPASPHSPFRHSPHWPLVGPRQPGRAGPSRGRGRLAHTVGRLAVAGGLGLAAMPVQALDINVATAEQLESLRGIGPRTAQIIVQERERAGPFESLEDLSDRVRGIGRKRLDGLQAAGLRVGAGVPVLGPGTVAMPQFAPAIPSLSAP